MRSKLARRFLCTLGMPGKIKTARDQFDLIKYLRYAHNYVNFRCEIVYKMFLALDFDVIA